MSTTIRRAVPAAVAVIAVIAVIAWFVLASGGPDDDGQDAAGQDATAVSPSDVGSDRASDGGSSGASDGGSGQAPPTETSDEGGTDGEDDDNPTAAPTSDMTDPEQVATAFMRAYPGNVADLSDPTFLASLDGVDAGLIDQINDKHITEAHHVSDGWQETYAYTIHGTYQGDETPVYSIVVSRPSDPAEGAFEADNDLPYRVDSFDWSPDMLGSEDEPGPAAGLVSPITDQQRGDLPVTIRDEVIIPVITYDADESEQERRDRLDELMVEPTDVEPISSRSGRYEMTIETTAWYYTTERGGPITIGYDGTWVDPYNNSRHGSWSLTATIARDDSGEFIVQSVEETVLEDPEQAED